MKKNIQIQKNTQRQKNYRRRKRLLVIITELENLFPDKNGITLSETMETLRVEYLSLTMEKDEYEKFKKDNEQIKKIFRNK